MSRSINIIKHLVDENLIDAKQETESYLNDVLSDVLKYNYEIDKIPKLLVKNFKPEELKEYEESVS